MRACSPNIRGGHMVPQSLLTNQTIKHLSPKFSTELLFEGEEENPTYWLLRSFMKMLLLFLWKRGEESRWLRDKWIISLLDGMEWEISLWYSTVHSLKLMNFWKFLHIFRLYLTKVNKAQNVRPWIKADYCSVPRGYVLHVQHQEAESGHKERQHK